MIVVPNVVEVEALTYLFTNIHKLRLFANNLTPAETDTHASFTQVTGGGYAEITLHPANWVITPGSPSYALYNVYAEWLFTGITGGTGNVYGYYVIDNVTNLLRYSERFPVVPFIPVLNARIRFIPRFECA